MIDFFRLACLLRPVGKAFSHKLREPNGVFFGVHGRDIALKEEFSLPHVFGVFRHVVHLKDFYGLLFFKRGDECAHRSPQRGRMFAFQLHFRLLYSKPKSELET